MHPFIHSFKTLCMYFHLIERKTEIPSPCSLPGWLQWPGLGWVEAGGQSLPLDLPWVQGPRCFGHLWLLSHAHWQRAGSEVEWLRLERAPIWDGDTAGGGGTLCATALTTSCLLFFDTSMRILKAEGSTQEGVQAQHRIIDVIDRFLYTVISPYIWGHCPRPQSTSKTLGSNQPYVYCFPDAYMPMIKINL